MVFMLQFVIVLALAATVYSAPQYSQYVQPAQAAYKPGYYADAYPDAPAKYEFAYEVNDPTTGDYHSQSESRDGDVTQGYYTLVEADGTKRIVEYSVNGLSGFNAVVRKEGTPSYATAPVAPVYRPAPVVPAYRPSYVQPSYVQPAYVQPAYRPSYVQPAYVQPAASGVYATTVKY